MKIEHTINSTDSVFRALNFAKVYGLAQSGGSGQLTGIENPSSSGDNLTTTTMNGISVQCHVVDVKSHTTHVFVAQNTLFGSPLESSNNGILDFIQVLYTLGAVDQNVGSHGVGAEAPDLPGFSDVIFVLIGQVTTTDLEVLFVGHFTIVNVLREAIRHRYGLHEKPVVLVGRLAQAHYVRLLGDSFSVGHNGVGLLDGDLCVILFQILETDLQMKFTSTGDDVLTRLFNHALNHRIRLGQAFKTFNQFGQISSVLGLNSHTHDRGDGELHDLQVVSLLGGGNGTSLDQKLINADKTTDVTARHIFDSLDVTSHHEDGPLDGLLVQVLLLAGEDTTESVEAAFVGGGHHLGDVHHQGAIGVARLHGHSSRIVIRAFVQHVGSVLLGGGRGRQMDNDHLEHSLTSWQPVPHDSLHQRLAFKLQFFVFHLSLQFQFVQKF